MAIRPESDPRNAAQRASAPKGELEQYGVWVKAEPQDIVEEAQAPHGDLDFDLAGDSASIPEESFLSEDEEKLLGSFDEEFETETSTASADPDFGTLPDMEELPSLDDSLMDPEAMIDISLTESDGSREPSPIHPGAILDFSAIEGLELEEPPRAARPQPRTENPMPKPTVSSEMEDVSAEFLDLPAEAPATKEAASLYRSASAASRAPGPQPEPLNTSGIDDVTSEFLDIDESSPGSRSPESVTDFETLDIDLHFDDTLPPPPDSGVAATDSKESGFEEVTEFDDFLAAGSASLSHAEEAEILEEAPLSRKASDLQAGGFDDVAALEQDLQKESGSPRANVAPAATAKPDLSTEILLKIADELSSIRGELISLRTALSDIKTQAAPEAAREAIAQEEPEVPASGFFDEEEDETIALTGDELDNILNTADFTEVTVEPGEPSEIDIEAAALMPPTDSSLLDEELLPESGIYEKPQAAIEEIHVASGKGAAPELSTMPLGKGAAKSQGDFGQASEELVRPMTEAPEDTSFLEGEAIEELESPELGDVPLVEPDLSDFDLEAEDLTFEPQPEIDEELPLVEPGAESLEEIPLLSLDEEPAELEEIVEEAEFLEPLPEIDEGKTTFGEIELHNEIPEESAPEEEPLEIVNEMPAAQPAIAPKAAAQRASATGDDRLKTEIRSVLSYLDKLLDSLPEEKIEEFARSEYFDTYKRLFEELGLV